MTRQTVTSATSRLFAYLVLEPLQALLPHQTLPRFETVTRKFKALTFYPAIPDIGLIRMQGQAISFDPHLNRSLTGTKNLP
jgi:hypothetical protein